MFESQLEEVKNSIYSEANLKQHFILRYRQEGDNGSLDKPVYEKFNSSEANDFLDALNLSNPLGETSYVNEVNYDYNTTTNTADGGTFALTSTNQSVEMRNSVRRFLKIDKSKFESKIMEKINGKRDLTTMNEKEGIRVMKNDMKALKTLVAHMANSESLEAMSERLATVLQKYLRRFLARCRVNKLRRIRLYELSTRKLQRVARGFIGRRRYKRIKRQHKIKSLINRKFIVRKFRAAVTISRFIRYCANKAILLRDGNNFDIHEQHGHSKLSRARFKTIIKEDVGKASQFLNSASQSMMRRSTPKSKSFASSSSSSSLRQKEELIPNLKKYLTDPYETARLAMAHLTDVKPIDNSSISAKDKDNKDQGDGKPAVVEEDMKAILKGYFAS